MDMKKRIILSIFALAIFLAQGYARTTIHSDKNTIRGGMNTTQKGDSVFKAHITNDEFQVWMDIDFYNNNIIVPRQEIFGKVSGYFGAIRDTRKWIVSDATIKGNKAILTIINDYGSEDLKAELRYNNDGTYTLTRLDGSTMKIVVNNKWVKIPKEIVFKRKP